MHVAAHLAFSFLWIPGPGPGNGITHSGWVFPQVTQLRSSPTGMPKGYGTGVFAHVLHSLFISVPKTRGFHKSFNWTYIKALPGFYLALVQSPWADMWPRQMTITHAHWWNEIWEVSSTNRAQHTDYFKMNVWCCRISHSFSKSPLSYIFCIIHSIQRGKKTNLV